MATAAANTAPEERPNHRFPKVGLASALTLAYAVAAAVLITLRAAIDALDFLSTGWILLLALVPLMPWLLPAIAPTATRLAPFVKNVKVLGVEISLSAAERPFTQLGEVEDALTEDHLVGQALMNTPNPFNSTDALRLIQGVQAMRSTGADAVVADLGQGMKWRVPNLYFLAWLLSNDPVTRWLVFTEVRAAPPGHFVGMCSCTALRRSIESVFPAYAAAGNQLEFHDPTQQQNQLQLANEFNKIRTAVAPAQAGEVATLAWVRTADISDWLGPHLVTTSIPWTGQLDRAGLETIARSNAPYAAATSADGTFRGLILQRQVVLEFTRRALAAS
jgi:hypothetical protein